MRAPKGFRRPMICDCGEHGFVGLTKGFVALVDPEDFWRISEKLWMASKGYAVRTEYNEGVKIYVKMHRLILGANDDEQIDHINLDRADNRRVNIRVCSNSENMCNRTHSGVVAMKGVSLTKEGRFRARIQANGLPETIGTFETPEAAATAYDKRALELHGEFARINGGIR